MYVHCKDAVSISYYPHYLRTDGLKEPGTGVLAGPRNLPSLTDHQAGICEAVETAEAEELKMAWGHIPHTSCVTLGKSLPLSESISSSVKWRQQQDLSHNRQCD